jgi:hypothetical protein
MKKIVQREITNEDGDVFGVAGDITRLGAYRAIREDMKSWGIADDVEFSPEDLEQCNFWHTDDLGGEYEGWTWWEKPEAKLNPKPLGKGWIYRVY